MTADDIPDAVPQPIYDWDDDPTVEIPTQTMREVVYGTEDTQPVRVPGHVPVGPSRPTRDLRPLGRGLGMGRKVCR